MKSRTLVRWGRRALLVGLALFAAFTLRRYDLYRIPEPDASLAPVYPGGTRVIVRSIGDDDALERGDAVVYAMEKDGAVYARFGRVYALPGDRVGARDGVLTVNDEPLHVRGEAMGEVPPGRLLILASNPLETRYPDSRVLGFIPREDVEGVVASKLWMGQ